MTKTVIMRGSRIDDPATGEFDFAWCDENGGVSDRYTPAGDWQAVKDELWKAGVKNYEVEWVGDNFTVTNDQESAESELVRAGELLWGAREALDEARELVVAALRDAIDTGTSEVRAARLAGVDRATVRKWIGKD